MHIFLMAVVLQVTESEVTSKPNAPVSNVQSPVSNTPRHVVKKPDVGNIPIAVPKLKLLSIERNIIAKTNAERMRNGKAALAMDPALMRSARKHCSWMARNRSLRHTGAIVAENIAMGQSSSSEAVQDWMNSPGHRANMLSGSYTRIGVAAYRAHDGRVYWCQQFIR